MKSVQSVRGMHDLLPDQSMLWRGIEHTVREVLDCYGYREIRIPVLEKTDLFVRAIGNATDVVEKEMYTFEDRNGDSLSLRPEGTAGVVRAAIEHGLLHVPGLKVWYHGPMFRHERPQKGRLRQFHQFGVEVFGIEAPAVDVELIALGERLWKALGIGGRIRLEINSLGSPESRRTYREKLVEYLAGHEDQLDDDSRRRLKSNPLRIFDSKVSRTRQIMADAPRLTDSLDEDSARRFDEVRRLLDALGIAYRINPGLVRGLDYYCETVFEWITDDLGAQGTVCAGGRYDGLVEIQGGRATPGIGFAMGVERLVELVSLEDAQFPTRPAVYIVCAVDPEHGLALAEEIRNRCPGLEVACDLSGGSFKSQFKRADRSGAGKALVLGEDELADNMVVIKDLRGETAQQRLSLDEAAGVLAR